MIPSNKLCNMYIPCLLLVYQNRILYQIFEISHGQIDFLTCYEPYYVLLTSIAKQRKQEYVAVITRTTFMYIIHVQGKVIWQWWWYSVFMYVNWKINTKRISAKGKFGRFRSSKWQEPSHLTFDRDEKKKGRGSNFAGPSHVFSQEIKPFFLLYYRVSHIDMI